MKTAGSVGAVIVLLASGGACTTDSLAPPVRAERFSFIVAGHAYGPHRGDNVGLYPKFLKALERQRGYDFLVLTGDFVRQPTEESYVTVLAELEATRKPFYLVRGNHDRGPRAEAIFRERYGGTYYSFSIGRNLFAFLDTRIRKYAVTPEQLTLLEGGLRARAYRNAFVFMHELLWLDPERYPGVFANPGDNPRSFRTSFWLEIDPLLRRHPDVAFHVIAGDVGGNAWAIPAFYDRIGNVTLLASGMGEVEDENLLRVDVEGSEVRMTVVPLWARKPVRPAAWWNVYNLRERLEHCVYPGCILPDEGGGPGSR